MRIMKFPENYQKFVTSYEIILLITQTLSDTPINANLSH